MSKPLLQLTYISDIPSSLTASDIAAIHQQANRNNQQLGLTGLLLHTGRHFMQLLEGPAPLVRSRFAIIAADPRHQQVRLISERSIAFGSKSQFPLMLSLVCMILSRASFIASTLISFLQAGQSQPMSLTVLCRRVGLAR